MSIFWNGARSAPKGDPFETNSPPIQNLLVGYMYEWVTSW